MNRIAPSKDAIEAARRAGHKRINLALQGGGSHGAFTWGVLDRLLEDPRVEIEGITGTSAGAMNAAALACGYAEDGRKGARLRLDHFWDKIAEGGRKSPIKRMPWEKSDNFRLDNTMSFNLFDTLTRLFSPYQLNPTNVHPIRDILDAAIDFDRLRRSSGIKLFIAATNVRSGKVKIFQNKDMSSDVLLASACLPFLFQAVEIDGEHYYDGGYMGNPCIYPLIYGCDSSDVLIVQINPLSREEIPTSARDIMDRVNEISFNSSLMREMRAVHFVSRLIDSGALDSTQYKRTWIHMIEADEQIKKLGASSKLNAAPEFLNYLKSIGRETAEKWLGSYWENVGAESTVDLVKTYL